MEDMSALLASQNVMNVWLLNIVSFTKKMNLSFIKNCQKIHFIGIGGIGMSALAFILREWNLSVSGSDLNENYLTPKLKKSGVDFMIGHSQQNIASDVDLVVKTSIIKDDNPEIIAAKARNIKIITRADLLAVIMKSYKSITIAGTHGKTSTTAMVSLVLEAGKLDPTVINGGVIHYYGSNSKIGQGDYLVAESDESDGSFVNLPTYIGAITNIEPEHLDCGIYNGDFAKQKDMFIQYIKQIPQNGLCVLCIDSPEVKKIHDNLSNKSNIITYSIYQDADIVAKNIVCGFDGLIFDAIFKNGQKIENIKIPIYGKHNIGNSLIAIAIADFLKISQSQIKSGLASFNGVKRRFTKVGNFHGASVIDDYAHHPTEIKVTIEAARNLIGEKGNIVCVFQPHKYTRVRDCFQEFCNSFQLADNVIVSQIYSAGQVSIAGIDQDSLISGIINSGQKNVIKLEDEKDLPKILKNIVKKGDLLLFMGAGTVTNWAYNIAEK